MKADQERVKTLLADTVTLLCKNGLFFSKQLKVQGLLGITVDDEAFIVHIDELFVGGVASQSVSQSLSNPDCVESHDESASALTVDLTSTNKDDLVVSCVPNRSSSPSLKRKQTEPVHSAVVQNRDYVNSSLNEPPPKCCIVESCVEESVQHIEKPKQEKDEFILDKKTNTIVIKEEKGEDFALLDSNPTSSDQKVSSNSPEFLQQLFNQFEPTTNDEFDGFDVDAYALHSQMTSDGITGNSTRMLPSTNTKTFNTATSDALSIWNSSIQPKLLSQGQIDNQIGSQVSYSQFENTDVCLLPNICLAGRRSTNIRRKRYECTLDRCGRQYQNTFDLFRHQRQKHHIPPEFYQQGKKQTFGIREIDPS